MKTTQKERYEVLARLEKLGIGYEDGNKLRRISLTLNRWFEMECGTENAAGTSFSIERDEKTEKPFQRMQYQGPSGWVDRRYPVADREAGARKRLAGIMARFPALVAYVQTDCRGAALYILKLDSILPLENIDAIYNRGVCVY